jgi:hypothetical protein
VADRYKMAQAQGSKQFAKVVEEDQRLLGAFGLGLLSVNNGLRVVFKGAIRGDRVNPWDVIEVNTRLWGWLRPLLAELQDFRAAKVSGANGCAKSCCGKRGTNGVNGVNGRGKCGVAGSISVRPS